MAIIKTEALLLKAVQFSDSSLILHFFTRESGRISILAKGARRLKSNFRGYLEPLSHVEIVYNQKPTREIQLLTSIDQIKIFLRNTASLSATVYATAIIESLDRFIRDHQQDDMIFSLAIAELNFADENPAKSGQALLHFLVHLARIIGYQLDFHTCSICRSPMTESWFSPDHGTFSCKSCSTTLRGEHLTGTEIEYLSALEQARVDDAILYESPKIPVIKAVRIVIDYLSYHLDYPVRLKSLDLLGSMTD